MSRPSTLPTDQELVRRALAGDPGAAEALLLRHDSALRREANAASWLGLRGRFDADDVMQEFYVKVCDHGFRALTLWRGLAEPGEASIEPYLKQIVRNVALDLRRRHRNAPAHGGENDLGDVIDPGPRPDETAEQDGLRAAVRRCIDAALNDGQRRVVQLYVEGRSHAEIAADIGIEAGNARVRLNRALAALRQCLERGRRNDGPAGRVRE